MSTATAESSAPAPAAQEAPTEPAPLATAPTSPSPTDGVTTQPSTDTTSPSDEAAAPSQSSPQQQQDSQGEQQRIAEQEEQEQEQSQPEPQRPRDPKVAQLKALFPDLEDGVLEAVIEGCGGSLDEATEQLLMMSDPSFKTDVHQLSQLEADEELARQIAREDEERVQELRSRNSASQRHAPPQQDPSQPRPLAYQAYVPKSRRTTGGAGGPASPSLSSWQPPAEQQQQTRQEPGQGQQRDELQELTEQLWVPRP